MIIMKLTSIDCTYEVYGYTDDVNHKRYTIHTHLATLT